MGVKNLWGIISCSGEAITIGSLGDAVQPTNSGARRCDREDDRSLASTFSNLSLGKPSLKKDSVALSSIETGHSFAGKALAIDLSCWVCDSQANSNMHSVTKPHLRYVILLIFFKFEC